MPGKNEEQTYGKALESLYWLIGIFVIENAKSPVGMSVSELEDWTKKQADKEAK